MTEVETRLAELLRADVGEAQTRLADLRRQAVEIQAEIDRLEWRVDHEETLLAERFGIPQEEGEAGEAAPKTAERPDVRKLSIRRGALLLLREHPRGMHVREIVEELHKRGKAFSGKTPHRSVSAILHQTESVKLLGGNRFALKPEAREGGAD